MELRALGQRNESKLSEIKLHVRRRTRPPWLRQIISTINQKEKNAISTSKTNNLPDFQSKKQRLSNLCKEKLSKPKAAKITILSSFPNPDDPKFHLSLSKLQKMETACFALFLLHRV
jgi:hypothetical protein